MIEIQSFIRSYFIGNKQGGWQVEDGCESGCSSPSWLLTGLRGWLWKAHCCVFLLPLLFAFLACTIYHLLSTEFLNLSTSNIWVWIILCSRRLSYTCPLPTRCLITFPNCMNQKCLQTLPDGSPRRAGEEENAVGVRSGGGITPYC